jgi:DNA-binding LacI/PurR family transcriptional regulator
MKRNTEQARPATLSDVARAARVAPITVSRAINGTGYVREAVRKRVLICAEKLSYRPNVLARGLKQSRMHVVGILLPDIANPFSAELMTGVQEVLSAHGCSSFLTGATRSVQQEEANLNALIDHRVDGLIVATRGTQLGDGVLRRMTRNGLPLVTVGHPRTGPANDNVTADHEQGAFELVTHLLGLGHKRIAFLGIRPEDGRQLRRYLGYVRALKQGRIRLDPALVLGPAAGPAFATQADGYDGMLKLARMPKPPTAVFARNDYAAIGALRAAHELGLKVPGDIAIAGFDNIPLSEYTTPPLTTVEQPIQDQGRRAAELLMERIERKVAAKPREVCFECRLVIRESTSGTRHQ